IPGSFPILDIGSVNYAMAMACQTLRLFSSLSVKSYRRSDRQVCMYVRVEKSGVRYVVSCRVMAQYTHICPRRGKDPSPDAGIWYRFMTRPTVFQLFF